jgi:hypothetical protein
MSDPHLFIITGKAKVQKLNVTTIATGAPIDLTGKTVRAVWSYNDPLEQFTMTPGNPGVSISNASAGEITIHLTQAEVANMDVDGQATLWLSVFNADNTDAVIAEPHNFLVRR